MTISKKSMKWIPWILILPVVIIRGFTTLYPIIVTLKNSLFDVKVLSGVNKFVGLANYVNVFKDPKVQTSISFTVEFVVVSMVFHVVLGVILALILNMKFKGRRFLRTIVLIPWAMPAVVIGPTVSIIGLSLAGNAVGDLATGKVMIDGNQAASPLICILCGIITLFITMLASTYGKKMAKLIPFIIGIIGGYSVATIFTVIGNIAGIDALKVIDFSYFTALVADGVTIKTFLTVPEFTFLTAVKGVSAITPGYVATIAAAYVPVAFVVFAEHIADHKNISSVIEKDLLKDPGLCRTLLGDGIGSMVGAFFGGCPNTTYGESIGCVAITRNASVLTIIAAAIGAIIISFVAPFVAIVNSIPNCVMGGVCMALYGFIAVSGLKMFKNLDLDDNRNLFVVSAILIAGIGGLTLDFGAVKITSVAAALILGIITNFILSKKAN